MIEINNLSYEINDRKILDTLSFSIKKREIYGIIGPNGSGKTTLLKHLYRTLPSDGSISFNGQALQKMSHNDFARLVAVVTQNHSHIEGHLSVEDIVTMGRYPHKGRFQHYNDEDVMFVSQALEKVELTSQKYQLFNTLSGGEKQRVRMAKAFCQQAQVLILDEPTNHLDLKHQVTLKKLLFAYEGTVILTLHDLNFASQLCDRLLLLKDGKLLMEGKTLDVLNSDKLTTAYETKFERQLQNGLLTINPIYD